MAANSRDLEKSLSSLTLNTSTSKSTKAPPKPFKDEDTFVADSWEDAAEDDIPTTPVTSTETKRSRIDSTSQPNAPPPTPISPPPIIFPTSTQSIHSRFASSTSSTTPSSSRPAPAPRDPEQRQEKTDAVARRMIAANLGIKIPPKSKEQREYDRAVREKEMRRKNEEREAARRAEEEKEKAKRSVWED